MFNEQPSAKDERPAARASHPGLARVSAIDGLRGAAALAVMLYHARAGLYMGTSEAYRRYGFQPNLNAWFGYITSPIGAGWLGVTLFFVLSGYCIHRRGARMLAAGKTINFREFARRRFFRIYPTYVCALLLTALIDFYVTKHLGQNPVDQNNSPRTLLISLLSMEGYLAPNFGSNPVFWTLAMEIHLYLAYPILFYLSKRHGPSLTLVFTLAAGLIYLFFRQLCDLDQYWPYGYTKGPVFLPYWFVWAVGFYLAEIEAGRARELSESTIFALMAAGALGGVTFYMLNHGIASDMCSALPFGGLVYLSMAPRGRKLWNGSIGGILSLVGVFSYSLYAIHAPVLWLIKSIASPGTERSASPLPAIEGAVFALAAGGIFFLLIERWSIAKPRIQAALHESV